jgi:Domain of unknown function (DUF4158)
MSSSAAIVAMSVSLHPPSSRATSSSAADQALIAERRDDHNRLGFALQLTTVRFLGTFFADPSDVPASVVRYVAVQLGLGDEGPDLIARYRESEARRGQTGEICRDYGYVEFSDPHERFALLRWLYARAWLSTERPSVLLELATARLVERKVLLPSVGVLTCLVASVRGRASDRLWRTLAAAPSPERRAFLEAHRLVSGGVHSGSNAEREAPQVVHGRQRQPPGEPKPCRGEVSIHLWLLAAGKVLRGAGLRPFVVLVGTFSGSPEGSTGYRSIWVSSRARPAQS